MRALLTSLDLHVPGEAGHAERVAVYAVATGHELGLDQGHLLELRRAATLHDIGKVAIEKHVLGKLAELTEAEFNEIKRHAQLAEHVLESMPWMSECLAMIRHHHERFDGSGYPDGLAGDSIPLGARIIAVAEAFDQMVSDCGWRDAVGEDIARSELEECAGTQFDPGVVEAFLRIQPRIQPLS